MLTRLTHWPTPHELRFTDLKKGDIVLIIRDGCVIGHPDDASVIQIHGRPGYAQVENLALAYVHHPNFTYFKADSMREAYEYIMKRCEEPKTKTHPMFPMPCCEEKRTMEIRVVMKI